MYINDFTKVDVIQAANIVKESYEMERKFNPLLPKIDIFPSLEEFIKNKLSVSAYIEDKLIGFLCCLSPWDHFSYNSKKTYSPHYANGVIYHKNINRNKVYSLLYQAAAKKWIDYRIDIQQ